VSLIAITGASGYIGQHLIAHLENQDWCTQILGTDIKEPDIASSKLTFLQRDIRDPFLVDAWKDRQIHTLVHLAFVLNPIHNEKEMFDVNVSGTLNILDICERLAVGHVIVASSATAYGAWPDNPEPITEDDPIRIFPPSFSYAHHKGIVEGHCRDFMARHPDVIFNIVRPCVVYGPNTDNYLSRYVEALPVLPLADGRDPHLQFVHEDDVAEFFALLIEKKIPGAFNLAGDGVIRYSEAAAMIGKQTIRVPHWLLYGMLWLLWHLRVPFVEAPPGIINFTSFPWVMDTTRAKTVLEWKPRYTSRETLRIMYETHGHTVVT